jgi:hypothetical protein
MTRLASAMIALAVAASGACGKPRLAAADRGADRAGDTLARQEPPMIKLAPVAPGALCVTKGAARIGERVTQPTMRAFAHETSGDAASLTFTYRGETEHTRALASGQERRQLGLKLRAANGCNLVYVMWRLDPKPALDVSVKVNPGMSTHKQCGAEGYQKVKHGALAAVPPLVAGETHTLRAEIDGDELTAWIDDQPAWRGTLPDQARALSGPAGLRSDNLAFDLVAFSAPAGPATTGARAEHACRAEDGD